MSWNFSAVYVDISTPERRETLQKQLSRPLPPDVNFGCQAFMSGDQPEDEKLAALSESYGDCIFLFIDSHSEYLAYHHWHQGKCVRRFSRNGDEGYWDLVEGEPESWETAFFHDESRLEQELSYEPERADEHRAVWERRLLQEGSGFPFTSAEDLASLVDKVFKLELFPAKR